MKRIAVLVSGGGTNLQALIDAQQRGELGGGEMGDINRDVISFLVKKNFGGWLCLEHDTHLQDPVIDLKISRDYIRKCGV